MIVNQGKPSVFIEAMLADDKKDHLEGIDFSVTSLLKSAREFQLVRRNKESLPERPLDNRLSTFLGHAVHKAVEESLRNNDDYLVEYRMEFDEEVNGKTYKVAGTCDMYDKKTKRLIDHKTTTTFIYGNEVKKEWVEQLNIYAHLLRRLGFPVEQLTINCVYKDWRPTANRYQEDYPDLPVLEFNFDPWPEDTAQKFYEEKLAEHVKAMELADAELPLCEVEYMWEKPSTYAVYKPGSARAIRLLPTRKDAEQYIKHKSLTGCQVEHRVGERTKCEKYCLAAPFCTQFQEWKNAQTKTLAQDVLEEIKVVS